MKKLLKPICLLRTFWYSINTFPDVLISGHNFREIDGTEEEMILECDTCGEISPPLEREPLNN